MVKSEGDNDILFSTVYFSCWVGPYSREEDRARLDSHRSFIPLC